MTKLALYSYYRSSCSWRIRLALKLKGLDYEYRTVNLLKEEQSSAEYLKVNPAGVVPALSVDGVFLSQSMAILEFLEEKFPKSKRLLPEDPMARAKIREIANIIACDVQPIQNLKILNTLASQQEKIKWAQKYIRAGLQAIEKLLAQTPRPYCYGDQLSFADIVLIPQVANARRFHVDMKEFPVIEGIDAKCATLPEFQAAHPSNQPDCPPDQK